MSSLEFSLDDSFIIASGTNVISSWSCQGGVPLIDKVQVQSMLGKNRLQEVHKGIILFDKNKGLILYTAVFSICSQCCFQGQQEKLRHWLSFPADQRACGSELTSNE